MCVVLFFVWGFCVGLLLLFGRVCGVSVVELSEVGSYKRLSESPSILSDSVSNIAFLLDAAHTHSIVYVWLKRFGFALCCFFLYVCRYLLFSVLSVALCSNHCSKRSNVGNIAKCFALAGRPADRRATTTIAEPRPVLLRNRFDRSDCHRRDVQLALRDKVIVCTWVRIPWDGRGFNRGGGMLDRPYGTVRP